MGAAVSVQHIYNNALTWFKTYFDESMYIADFHSIDKDNNGGVSFQEFEAWIQSRANHDHGNIWSFFVTTPEVLRIAHELTGRVRPDISLHSTEKIVDVIDFRNLLVHLFAISVLYTHFHHADEWKEGNDVGNRQLTFDEFCLACQTLSSAYGNSPIDDDQLRKDFQEMDRHQRKYLTFLDVCDYGCQFVHEYVYHRGSTISHRERSVSNATSHGTHSTSSSPRHSHRIAPVSSRSSSSSPKHSIRSNANSSICPSQSTMDHTQSMKRINSFKTNTAVLSDDVHTDDEDVDPSEEIYVEYLDNVITEDLRSMTSSKTKHLFDSNENKNQIAFQALQEQLQFHKSKAEFVEVKFNTELEIKRLLYGSSI